MIFLSDEFFEFQSKAWRFSIWIKGYGSYDEIDRKVSSGELIPFVNYPEKQPCNKLKKEQNKWN